MIEEIFASDPRFRSVRFEPGFNAVLADTTEVSSDKDSRNGLGKSTLIEIIQFCLGSKFSSCKALVHPELHNWSFYLRLSFDSRKLLVARSCETPTKVTITGDLTGLPVSPKAVLSEDGLGTVMSTSDWTSLLGHLSFGLPLEPLISTKKETYRPSFRGLISYFARNDKEAYIEAFKHFGQQHEWDKQLSNAFLLGLEWRHAAEWQVLKDRENKLKEYKKAVEDGVFPGNEARLGELQAFKVRLNEEINREAQELKEFKTNPQYHSIEIESNELTDQIHELNEQLFSNQRLIKFYQKSLKDERPPSSAQLLKVYEDAKVQISDMVKKRFEDVDAFHTTIIKNRRNFLSGEITRLKGACTTISSDMETLDKQRAKLLHILDTHGALEEFSALQSKLNEKTVQLRSIERQIEVATKLDLERSQIKVDKELLFQKAQADLGDRADITARAISLFNSNSEFLYDAPGQLVIEVTKTGFKYDVEIPKDGSDGIDLMKIFCYDMMLSQLWSTHESSPEFLIHDSALFADVDERQIGLALNLAKQQSELRGTQYICMLNSDKVPFHRLDFVLDDFVRIKLTDDRPENSLLGLRLPVRQKQKAIKKQKDDTQED